MAVVAEVAVAVAAQAAVAAAAVSAHCYIFRGSAFFPAFSQTQASPNAATDEDEEEGKEQVRKEGVEKKLEEEGNKAKVGKEEGKEGVGKEEVGKK